MVPAFKARVRSGPESTASAGGGATRGAKNASRSQTTPPPADAAAAVQSTVDGVAPARFGITAAAARCESSKEPKAAPAIVAVMSVTGSIAACRSGHEIINGTIIL